MARIRVFVVLVLALTAGGVLAFGTYNYVQSAQTRTVTTPTRSVVVAATDLEVGAELTNDDLKIIDWPVSAVPEGAIAEPKDIIGRGLIMAVVKNEPILSLKMASNEVIGVAGYVTPGTRVDVVATVNPTSQQQDITSKVILTDVQVLAAGTKLERTGDKEKPVPVTVVTLLVDPNEAERLTLASSEGKIQLALRNPLDKERPVTLGVRPALLLGTAVPVPRVSSRRVPGRVPGSVIGSVASVPLAVAVNQPTVEIIRGDKRAHETVRGVE
jgi:pilus assembly protein CpaB